jgi:hypothetical protein
MSKIDLKGVRLQMNNLSHNHSRVNRTTFEPNRSRFRSWIESLTVYTPHERFGVAQTGEKKRTP